VQPPFPKGPVLLSCVLCPHGLLSLEAEPPPQMGGGKLPHHQHPQNAGCSGTMFSAPHAIRHHGQPHVVLALTERPAHIMLPVQDWYGVCRHSLQSCGCCCWCCFNASIRVVGSHGRCSRCIGVCHHPSTFSPVLTLRCLLFLQSPMAFFAAKPAKLGITMHKVLTIRIRTHEVVAQACGSNLSAYRPSAIHGSMLDPGSWLRWSGLVRCPDLSGVRLRSPPRWDGRRIGKCRSLRGAHA